MSTQSNDPRDSDPQGGYAWGSYYGGGPWGPYRGRGFAPLFRGMYSDQHLRVSDAERQAVTDRLSEHFAAGRLDQAEEAEPQQRNGGPPQYVRGRHHEDDE